MATCKNTLFIRHIPQELTNAEKEELFRYFGASSVSIPPNRGPLGNSAFATFNSDELATQALNKLHQFELLDSCLIVQYARQQYKSHFPFVGDFPRKEKKNNKTTQKETNTRKHELQRKLRELYHQISGLSENFGLLYPISPKLRYHYPPPNPSIIANISHALVTVPKFYTQVLHLMNKMNLPSPFGPLTPIPVMKPELPQSIMSQQMASSEYEEDNQQKTSDEESELSSDEEAKKKDDGTVLLKRSKNDKGKSTKRIKLYNLKQLQSIKKEREPPTNPEEVFEVSEGHMAKRIELKLPATVLKGDSTTTVKVQENIPSSGGFGQFEPVKTDNDERMQNEGDEEQWENLKFISRRHIKENRLGRDEMKKLPVFKNYEAGERTTRLYIKNLSRQVEEKDIYSLYGYYVNEESETEKNMFDIRLMKEGRMKGQAFVTFPSEKQAETALKDTNGYILLGKPLVVQYARSAKPKIPGT